MKLKDIVVYEKRSYKFDIVRSRLRSLILKRPTFRPIGLNSVKTFLDSDRISKTARNIQFDEKYLDPPQNHKTI